MPEPFLALLHDATLVTIEIDWASGCCSARLRGGPSLPGAYTVTWSGVTDVHVPRTLAWGPSVSVLSASEVSAGRFELEMQSGDVIAIVAQGVALVR